MLTAVPPTRGDLIADRYRLLRPIGTGGMGAVWAARHELLGRVFALKLPTFSDDDFEGRARFLREAQIVGRLRHPNVVDVADVGDAGPGLGLYLAMELLEGESLAAYLGRRGPLPLAEALVIASQVARGLGAAHAAGVVHRDVKPENIFLARSPEGGTVPKILDFGISKWLIDVGPSAVASDGAALVTVNGRLLGTPAYMSPEQARGEADVDHRSDLWSLGVVLYEMLGGRRPFEADSCIALLVRISECEPAPLPDTIPAPLRALIARCLAKARDDRLPTAIALREAFDAVRAELAAPPARPTTISPAPPPQASASIAPASMVPAPARPSSGASTWSYAAITAIAVALGLGLASDASPWRAAPAGVSRGAPAAPTKSGDEATSDPTVDPTTPMDATPSNAEVAEPPSAAVPYAPADTGALLAPSTSTATLSPPPLPPPQSTAAPHNIVSTRPPETRANTLPRASSKSVTRVNSAGF